MGDARFSRPPVPLRLGRIAELAGAKLARGDPGVLIRGAAPLATAGPDQIGILLHSDDVMVLAATRAAACFSPPKSGAGLPGHVGVLEAEDPNRAFALYLAHAYPDALRPRGLYGQNEKAERQGAIHPDARLEPDIVVEPGAIVGAGAEIGGGTVLAAGAVIGAGVAVGRDCFVGANATIQHALIGNRVVIHPGACIGQDGLNVVGGAVGNSKIAQIGRVIVQDDVEIGANATISRGGIGDTVLGEGSRIADQAHIGQDVEIGRHCMIGAQAQIAGSARLGDFVAVGPQASVAGHVAIGEAARIAAHARVHVDASAGARYGSDSAPPERGEDGAGAALPALAKPDRAD